jgi:hypothetical protein
LQGLPDKGWIMQTSNRIMGLPTLRGVVVIAAFTTLPGPSLAATGGDGARLFPTDLPGVEWVTFPAEGFPAHVTGVIHRTGKSPCCGVPLGGISTGCVDIDPAGTIGFCSIFNGYPRSPKLFAPFLGLAVDGGSPVSQKTVASGFFGRASIRTSSGLALRKRSLAREPWDGPCSRVGVLPVLSCNMAYSSR